jgi:hypothetical protein
MQYLDKPFPALCRIVKVEAHWFRGFKNGTPDASQWTAMWSPSLRRPETLAPSDERAIRSVAERFVRTWSFTTVEMVAGRFRPSRPSTQTRTSIVRRALALMPELRWLDPACEWFSLLDCASPATATLDKIVSIFGPIDREELFAALDKRHTFRDVPHVVVQSYVSALLARPRATTAAAGARLSNEEHTLVALLDAAGGSLDTETLRHQAAARGFDAATVMRALQASPLFLRSGRGLYRLVSVPSARGEVAPSPRWEATVAAPVY